jgi:hypothetical protein
LGGITRRISCRRFIFNKTQCKVDVKGCKEIVKFSLQGRGFNTDDRPGAILFEIVYTAGITRGK